MAFKNGRGGNKRRCKNIHQMQVQLGEVEEVEHAGPLRGLGPKVLQGQFYRARVPGTYFRTHFGIKGHFQSRESVFCTVSLCVVDGTSARTRHHGRIDTI